MEKLGWPTLFCNSLEVAENGEITGFKMRCEKSKLTTVKALQSMGFETIASGDSYNDLGMIQGKQSRHSFSAVQSRFVQIIRKFRLTKSTMNFLQRSEKQ